MTNETSKPTQVPAKEHAMNRRRLLKVAVATAPVIATLPSGAALARSSNLIGSTSGPGTDALGRLQCLDRSSGSYDDGIVDLGVPARGRMTAIKPRDYRVDDNGSASTITEKQMCEQGGEFFYRSDGWRSVRVPRGIVVSATALSSFAGSIYTTEV